MKTIAFTGGDTKRGLGSIIKCLCCELISIDQNYWPEVSIVINSQIYTDNYEDNIYKSVFINNAIEDIQKNWVHCNQMHPKFPINDMFLKDRIQYHNVLKYFFSPKYKIQKIIDDVVQKMGACPLTVHYRGNDKAKEITVYSAEYFLQTCLQIMKYSNFSSIFLATDSLKCLETFINNKFDIPLIYNDFYRIESQDIGIHHSGMNYGKYTILESSVIDIFCLAHGKMIVSGVSNLVDISTILSPYTPWLVIR